MVLIKASMMKAIPWILTILLVAALVVTNLPAPRVPLRKLPADLRQFGETCRWSEVYRRNDLVIWKVPADGPKDCSLGEGFAVTHKGRLAMFFMEDSPSPMVFRDGQIIARVPWPTGARETCVSESDGVTYHLWDFDQDGIPDIRTATNGVWLYRHGDFVPATVIHEFGSNGAPNLIRHFIAGREVQLKGGRWTDVLPEDKGSSNTVEDVGTNRAGSSR